MTLRLDLARIIKRASAKQALTSAGPGATDRAIFSDLHQVLTGPAGSGKTFYATEYAKALAMEGLVKNDAEPLVIHCEQIRSEFDWKDMAQTLQDFDRSVIILEEVDKLSADHGNLMQLQLVKIIDDRKGVAILTGYEEHTGAFLQTHTALAARLPDPLSMSVIPEPTPEEIAEKNRQEKIAEWRGMTTIAVHVGKRMKTPGRARFTKNKTPVT